MSERARDVVGCSKRSREAREAREAREEKNKLPVVV
jgi:hypothetical protein